MPTVELAATRESDRMITWGYDLTSDEATLIDLVRQSDAPINIMLSNFGPQWTVVLTTPDGTLAGTGDSFREALVHGFGGTLRSDPEAKLKLVAGTDLSSTSNIPEASQ